MYKSLKSKLIVNNVAVLLVFGGILFFQFNNSLSHQRDGIRESFQINSDKISSSISQSFYAYYHNIQAISKNGVLRTKNFEESKFLFNELVSLYPVYDFVLLTDLEGNYIASNSMDNKGKELNIDKLKGKNFASKSWFKESKEGKFTEDMNKKIFGSRFGDIQKSSIGKLLYGKNKFGFHVSTQVQDEYGDPVAIMTTFVSSKWIKKEIINLSKTLEKQGIKDAVIEVHSKNNTIIGSSDKTSKLLNDVKAKNTKLIKNRVNYSEQGFIGKLMLSTSEPLVAFSEIDNDNFITRLGWKTFITTSSDQAFAVIESSKWMFSISLIVSLFFVSFFTYYISHKLSQTMQKISEKISSGSSVVHSTTDNISEQAHLLFDSTTEQASSLQQTVSSLTEISAMVSKNTAHSQNSKELSNLSRNSANSGVTTIGRMMQSIEDISSTNQDIVTQMNQNAVEMADIIKVISNIEEKTKVINDIVFQTKLLSFNASVEAARAGEHGKGFSVVAEEVGNLAKTSGEAAKEIEELLNKSITQVKHIVDMNKEKVEDLVNTGVQKVNTGKEVAENCRKALEEILTQSVELDQAIEDIATASIEQSKGIDEIAKAMEQLDVVTKKNSEIAKVVSKGTESLNNQSNNLNDVSDELSSIIHGTDFKSSIPKDEPVFNEVQKIEVNKVNEVVEEQKPSEVSFSNDNVVEFKNEKKDTVFEEPIKSQEKLVAGSDIVLSSDDDWEDL